MAPTVEKVSSDCFNLGEGPHWDEESQTLYYVDIHRKTIHKYNPSSGRETKSTLDGPVGFIVPVAGKKNQFVAGIGLKFVLIEWAGDKDDAKVIETLAEVEQEPQYLGSRINDGKADPKGRIYGGTMGKEEPAGNFMKNNSALYTISKSGASAVQKNISLSNGLAWDVNKNLMYHIDSVAKSIYVYDYNFATGDMSNKKVLINFEETGVKGLPDGMTIDTNGNLWVACFGGSQVVKIDPVEKKVLQTVPIPAEQVTSVAFGGKNLDELYVTTASMIIEGRPQLPPAGSVFKVTGLGVKGYAGNSCNL